MALLGDIRHPGKEALLVFLGVQLIAEIAEIHLEGRIGDDVVELLQRLAVPVIGMQQGVALDDVGDGVDQVVQNQVQAQQAGGFLRDVLGVDGAALLADGVGQVHQQGAGPGRGIVAGDVFDLAACSSGTRMAAMILATAWGV